MKSSPVVSVVCYSKGFCCRWKHGGNDRILASSSNVIIRSQIRTVCVCVLRTSGWTRKNPGVVWIDETPTPWSSSSVFCVLDLCSLRSVFWILSLTGWCKLFHFNHVVSCEVFTPKMSPAYYKSRFFCISTYCFTVIGSTELSVQWPIRIRPRFSAWLPLRGKAWKNVHSSEHCEKIFKPCNVSNSHKGL